MKKFNLIIVLTFFGLISQAQSITDTSMVVNGVCGMCKSTIEKAAQIEGVSFAEWSKETLVLKLKFDPQVTNLAAISKSITKSGYDTEFQTASDSSYYSLDPCCYYRDPSNVHKHK